MVRFNAFKFKMLREKMPEVVIESFRRYYEQLISGSAGYLRESDIIPLTDNTIPSLSALEQYTSQGLDAIRHCAVLKLNGGLGTTMGLSGPKSLLTIKSNLTFLDIIIRQMLYLREQYNASLPLLLMNSFSTNKETSAVLDTYPQINAGFPVSFLQSKFPRIMPDSFAPAECAADSELEWAPPGHGEIYTIMHANGILKKLIAGGIEYLFVSNCDNLGAILDLNLLGYFADSGSSMLMEVTRRTEMDKKGGHCAKMKDGRLVLRESAQCHPDDTEYFQDINRHGFFNTNNLWINVRQVQRIMDENKGILTLPLIVNQKPMDPGVESSRPVLQLESAMGSAISVFDKAGLVLVPRDRFAPVKKCDDLLPIRSDRYQILEDYRIVMNPDCAYPMVSISLDPSFFGRIADFEKRFPSGAPSLIKCASLTVKGDVVFGANVTVRDEAIVENGSDSTMIIQDGMEITGKVVKSR
jgi:UTP--glucose-1-phosphate uridylyltransferase